MTSAELERNIADELSWDPKIDSKAIAVSVEDGIVTLRGVDATVKDGFVTLTGGVDWQYQRNEANLVAGNVPGLTGVNDQIYLIRPMPNTDGVEHSIGKAFTRDARLDAYNLTVVISNGTASLTGTVRSWSDRDAAVAAAWSAPGIIAVIDSLNVIY